MWRLTVWKYWLHFRINVGSRTWFHDISLRNETFGWMNDDLCRLVDKVRRCYSDGVRCMQIRKRNSNNHGIFCLMNKFNFQKIQHRINSRSLSLSFHITFFSKIYIFFLSHTLSLSHFKMFFFCLFYIRHLSELIIKVIL